MVFSRLQGEDGQNFSAITRINATGNANYSFADLLNSTSSPVLYYRLKSVDKDGDFKLSTIVKIKMNAGERFAEVSPNPFKENLKVNIESPSQDKVTLIVTDLSGRKLLKQNKNVFAGKNTIDINGADKFAKGSYLLTIIASQRMQTIKIIKGN